jgi:hypothetical protein
MNKTNKYVLLVFFIILISVPGYWLLRGKPSPQVSIVEGRVLGLPENSYPTLKIAMNFIKQGEPQKAVALVWDLYTGGSLQKKFDGAATDQFPFRMALIKFAKTVDREIIKLSYSLSGDEVIPADMTSEIYIMLNQEALIVPPGIFDEIAIEKIDERLTNYQELVFSYPEINFYIYYLETLPFSQYHPLNAIFAKVDKGQSFNYFRSKLSDRINLGYLPLKGVDDHLQHYYRTDHHANTAGILEAYRGIYNLLSSKYTNIPPQLEPSMMVNFPDISFWGTLARRTLYPIQGDEFIGFQAGFPNCTVSDNGEVGVYDSREEYLQGKYPTEPYVDHYGNYFGSQQGLLEYRCEIQTNRNILIVGDSYARPLVNLIANHYKHTFYVDLRQNADFSLSEFTSSHDIDDFLIVSDYEVIFMDTDQWKINP